MEGDTVLRFGALDVVLSSSWDDLYALAQEVGFDGVELGIQSGEAKSSPLWQEAVRERLRAASQQTGVATASLCLHGWGGLAADPHRRAEAISIATDAVGFAAELGAQVILVPLNAPSELSYEEAAKGWVEALRQAGPIAASAGVTLAMESVGRQHTQSAERFHKLMDATEGRGVGIYYDIGNALYQGYEPLGDIRALGKAIVQIHFKQPGKYLLVDGPLNLSNIYRALSDIGYDGWIVLETATLDNPIESAKSNLRALQNLQGAR